jgi:CubicO group peptidase (beta-lactamase class C family)
MRETEIVQELEHFLEQLFAKDDFSGSVLVAKETRPLFKKGYGLASQDFNAPNHAETKFHLASLSKMFTSVAVAQLVEQGALSFHDPVSQYLTDYPRDIAEKVTIHHLASPTLYQNKYGISGFTLIWLDFLFRYQHF